MPKVFVEQHALLKTQNAGGTANEGTPGLRPPKKSVLVILPGDLEDSEFE